MPTVDLLIPVYKPNYKLELLLKGIKKQSLPIRRIIIMDSDEASFNIFFSGKETLRDFKDIVIKHISNREFDHGKTRNKGMKLSDADYVLCMTQDAVPADEKLVETMVDALKQDKVAVCYARQIPNVDCREMERFTRSFNYPDQSRVKGIEDLEELGIKTFFCSNVCAMYNKNIYDELGGFIKKTIFNEDMIFAGGAIQKGYKIAYVADALVYHSHNYGAVEQLKRNFDLGVSQADHPEIFEGIKSESEGKKLVKKTAKHLIQEKCFGQVFLLIVHSGYKYIGYKLGKNYQKLSKDMIMHFTMNKRYWDE